jgi:hypothetical protein
MAMSASLRYHPADGGFTGAIGPEDKVDAANIAERCRI